MNLDLKYRNSARPVFSEYLRILKERVCLSWEWDDNYIEYLLHYSNNPALFDKSFIATHNGYPVAAVFLPVEGNSVCIRGDYVTAPVVSAAPGVPSEKIEKEIYRRIDDLKLDKVMFYDSEGWRHNVLRRYNYLDTTTDRLVLDPFKEKLSKGHKHTIKKIMGSDSFHCQVNNSVKAFCEYKELHYLAAGRNTRSEKTWFIQLSLMVLEGKADLVALYHKDEMIGASYFIHNNVDKVRYFSGADNPKYDDLPIYHPMLHYAIEMYRDRGFKELDFGAPCGYGDQLFDLMTDKQKNIAHFKRGFGGELLPLFRGIKARDPKRVIEEELNKW